MNFSLTSSLTWRKLRDSAELITWLWVNWIFTSNGWLYTRFLRSKRTWMFAVQFISHARDDCERLVIRFCPCFFLTWWLWIQCLNSQKRTQFSVNLKLLDSGIMVFEWDSNAATHPDAFSSLHTSTNTSSSKFSTSKFSYV